jgi:hypothetical protein
MQNAIKYHLINSENEKNKKNHIQLLYYKLLIYLLIFMTKGGHVLNAPVPKLGLTVCTESTFYNRVSFRPILLLCAMCPFPHCNHYILVTGFNPNPNCLGILKAFFVKMKISPGWFKQNIFKNQKCLAKNLNKLVCFRVLH